MKDAEDEAFDDLARRQGDWGGGFQAKRQMAADKLQEPWNEDELAKRQGAWGGGFPAKRAAAADKLQEPVYKITVFDNAYPKGIPLEDWVQPPQEPWNEDEWRKNNWRCHHGWLRGEQCEICNAPPAPQRQWVGLTNDEVNNFAAGCHLGKSVQGAIYEAEAKLKEKNFD